MASIKGLIQRFQTSLPWRAWQRYGQARGGVLAGGMSYAAFFSIFPALALGFTAFGLVVGDDPDLQRRVIDSVNSGLGTTIISPPGQTGGVVSIDTLTGSSELTVAGIIGLVGFLFTGLGWLDAMREGVRAMFGQPVLKDNVVKTKARDLVVLVTIGLVLVVSAVAGLLVSSATGAILGWVGLDGSLPGRIVLGVISTMVILGVDLLIFLVIFRLLSGVDVPTHDLWDAALFGGIGLGVLKLSGGLLLKGASNNKFLATAGVLLGLLVWLNLVSRLTLIAAAWGATVAIDRGHLADHGQMELPEAAVPVSRARAGRADGSRPAAAAAPVAVGASVGVPAPPASYEPEITGRQADRVSLAAGAVLGAAGLFAVRTGVGAVRALVSVARRSDD